MKRLYLIAPKFAKHIGGMETHAVEFAKGFLNSSDFPLSRIFTRSSVPDGIQVQDSEKFDAGDKCEWGSLVENVLSGDFVEDAKSILSSTNPNNSVYFFNTPTWIPSAVYIKKCYPQSRVVIRSGGNDIVAGWIGEETHEQEPLEVSRAKIVNGINKFIDYLIVNSDFSFNRMLSVGIAPERMKTVIGGVDCEIFYPKSHPNEKITIVTSGRMVGFKGMDYSLEAVMRVSKDFPVKYILVGDGPERPRLEQVAYGLGISDIVEFLGPKRLDEIPPILRMADIFLHLPIEWDRNRAGNRYIHTETMGRSYCEAAASGLPSVASGVGGVPEVVQDGITGYLVPPRDVRCAAWGLTHLIENAPLRSRMSAHARELALNKLDWRFVFDAYRTLFE